MNTCEEKRNNILLQGIKNIRPSDEHAKSIDIVHNSTFVDEYSRSEFCKRSNVFSVLASEMTA